MEEEVPSGPHVFLSYRRDDASAYAGRLYDYLVGRFGDENVFIDIDSIEPGVDFADALQATLAKCDTVLVIIGRYWLSTTDRDGRRRIDNPDDFVRFEVERALAWGTRRIIPVLVGGAQIPDVDELPESLARITRRQAFELSDQRWSFDVRVLADKIEKAAIGTPSETSAQPHQSPVRTDEGDKTESRFSWDSDGLVAEALAEVVATYGPQALTEDRSLANRLSDLLAEDTLQREQSLVLAASRRDVAKDLEELLSQGIGVDAAVRLISERLQDREALDSSGCAWVTDAFAEALGYLHRLVTVAYPPPTMPQVPEPETELVSPAMDDLGMLTSRGAGVEGPSRRNSPEVPKEPDPPLVVPKLLATVSVAASPLLPEDDHLSAAHILRSGESSSSTTSEGNLGYDPTISSSSNRKGRKLRITAFLVAILAAAGTVAALSSMSTPSATKGPAGTTSSSVRPTTTTTSAATTTSSTLLGTTGPKSGAIISITPSTGLSNDQVVSITGTGYPANESVAITECANKGAETGAGDCNLGGPKVVTATAAGTVSSHYQVLLGPFGTNMIVCTKSPGCLVSVAQAGVANPNAVATELIHFG